MVDVRRVLVMAALAAVLGPGAARAATGVCDSNPPVSTEACVAAIQNGGTVVNDVFKDANGLTADQLPVFGSVFDAWPGCSYVNFGGCAGQSLAPFDCPGQYQCAAPPATLANAGAYLNALDRLWWQPCRLANSALDASGCPIPGCIADGVGGNYHPRSGLVFDLGGPSNQVAVFAENDHGPQPCESTEYTVFLTDNPFANDVVLDPKTTGVDPQKWNRAVLTKIFTKGFVEVRPPDPVGHAACGDTPLYSVEEDSFVSVYALPCGVTFRYAAVVAGNDGLDFPECAFDSNEGEIDAVAGLTESGAAVCPDADKDLYPDCNCLGAPPMCDCHDADPSIHPGAPEACDAPDLDCDGLPGGCDAGEVCHQSLCVPTCEGEIGYCPAGSACETVGQDRICVPADCMVGGCPPGGVCSNGVCVPACTGVVCPAGQECLDGVCRDPCGNILCPAGLSCQGGVCLPPCTCLAGDIGCGALPGTVCDETQGGACVPPMCEGKTCPAGEHCDPATGQCAAQCAGVVCPVGQECREGMGCVSKCDGVTCDPGRECDPPSGTCIDPLCKNVDCTPPTVCVAGQCVDPTPDAGPGAPDASVGHDAGGGGGDGDGDGDGDGCGCHSGGAPGGAGAGAGALLALAALVVARRRRR
jgi:MYXO-CTERM domain-containing protein